MTSNYKTGDVWKQNTPYVNVNNTWKVAKSAWVNLGSQWKSWFLQGGLNDTGFTTSDTANGSNNQIDAVAIQSDGKLLFGGFITSFNGITVGRIIRLNSNGTLDTAFNTNLGSGANSSIVEIAVQSDGKLILVGSFTSFNGFPVGRVVRLNSDGTLDTTFTTNTGTGANNTVTAVAIQSDGKIVLGGVFDLNVGSPTNNFSTWNGATVNRIVRLNADGTRDTAFTTNTGAGASASGALLTGSYGIFSIQIQIDGKIIIGGNYLTFNGVTVNRIVRLNSDGTRDTAFTTNTGTGAGTVIFTIAIQSDDKIVLSGAFLTFNGVTVNRIVRLNADGTRDTAFTTGAGTGANNTATAVAIQSDGKIVLGGVFTTFNGATVNRIVRLNSDGTMDTSFTTNTGTGASGGDILAIAIQTNGKIAFGGAFTTFNGVTVNRICALNLDGTLDTVFVTWNGNGFNNTINAITIHTNTKIFVGGTFTAFANATVNRLALLNLDGTLDTTFNTNIGTGFNNTVNAVEVQTDGKILIGGLFTTFNGVTATRLIRLNADGTPDTAFNTNLGTGASNTVLAIKVQTDGKILVGGSFSSFNTLTAAAYLLRLNSDGTRDTAFNTAAGTGPNTSVRVIAIQTDNKILIGGDFTTFSATTVNRVARLESTGTRDAAFTTNAGSGASASVQSVAIQSNGRILFGGAFTTFKGLAAGGFVGLNSDGTLDTTFNTNTGTEAGNVAAIAVQTDDKIILGGNFQTFNGVTSNYVARLLSSGIRDAVFTTNGGTGFNNTVNAIKIQSDGKAIIGGTFIGYNQLNRTRLARIGGDIAQ